MRLICLHQEKLNPLIQVGAVIDDLTPKGLWDSEFHLISISDEQFDALKTIYGDNAGENSYQDVTPEISIEQPTKSNGFMYCRGGKIENGVKLRANYMGKNYEAEVAGGKIWYDGKKYSSPSRAAGAITYNNVNGWRWWEYYDEDIESWRSLDSISGKYK